MKNKKLVLIVFYFGPFPLYFSLFLHSCSYNSDITWWIFTDNTKSEEWPVNVKYFHMTLEECHSIFQKKFSYPISLENPKKLCDYKPLYGYLLEEWMRDVDFWGHCDLDVIYGTLNIPETLLEQYDKLYTLGHFSLYRNTSECNRCLLNYKNGERVKKVLQNPSLVAFDEWGKENANDIFRRSGFRFLESACGADIWPERERFQLSEYNSAKNRYRPIPGSEGIFRMNHGKLYYVYFDRNQIEVPYAHFQKRVLPVNCAGREEDYFIIPEGFFSVSLGEDAAIERGKKRSLVDKQYVKVKARNIKNRWKKLF